MPVSVLIADDHELLRAGLKALLERQGITVVGEAGDGRSAVRMARELRPAVVIMDVSMPHMNGIDATTRVLEAVPDTRVLALSMHADRRFVMQILDAGASGYLLKESSSTELIRAVREVVAGRRYLTAALAERTLDTYAEQVGRTISDPYDLLTERERLNQELQEIIDEQTEPWGIKVSTVEVKDVELPQDMQRAIALQAQAERERRAKIIGSEGEYQAAQKLADAADIISQNPATLQLRYLQTLLQMGVNQNTTIVFPLPIELMNAFSDWTGGGERPPRPKPPRGPSPDLPELPEIDPATGAPIADEPPPTGEPPPAPGA